MENTDRLRQQVRHQQRLIERLQLAAVRLIDAQLERTWAIVSAHQQGLSIRQMATATGLSSTRVHQILTSAESQEIPVWLSRVREQTWEAAALGDDEQADATHGLAAALMAEVAALRQCVGWLEQAAHGETVVVNLRPATEAETEYVSFDRRRILRVLGRIAADLETIAREQLGERFGAAPNEEDARTRHRRRLAEHPPQAPRLSPSEERAALRAALGLPPK